MKKQLICASLFAALALTAWAKDESRFVTPLDAQPAPQGLDGANIALWQSHGWYFEPKLNRWEWQRARIFQTVEDLYTQSYVMPYLMPMLQNAGAYVMSPRERDIQDTEYIIDNNGSVMYAGQWTALPAGAYAEANGKKKWADTKQPGFAYDGSYLIETSHPFQAGTARVADGVKDAKDASTISWGGADIQADGDYAVYVSYQSLPNSATDVVYTINTAMGPKQVKVNQKMGGGTWIYLGHYPFKAGVADKPLVQVSNLTADKKAVVTADAVKIGGGVGNVSRRVLEGNPEIDYRYVSSGYPRFTEGARYWLQWAGAPDSVFTPSENVNDYGDDYKCRGLWVNWMAGGSKMLPNQEGLGVPIDLSLAFHSDAGTTLNDSIIGTLGIYCTDGKQKYPGGQPREAAHRLTDLVMTNITDDVRAQFEPNWTRRQMWNKSYFECRVPQVPAMLLELLSHQNFADMKYGLDPAFRFTVSRAIYKAMLQFIAERDGRPYVVQPLPVRSMAIANVGGNKYKISWQPTVDSLEVTAMPTYYIVETRVDPEIGYTQIAKVDKPEYEVTISDNDIHSYRIVACNAGGISFPSETLALRYVEGKNDVLIVNGFTRVSAPDWFDSGEIAGFYDVRDPGVPYIQDISFIGSQFEFRRDIPWMDDDAAGFGASRSNYEKEVIAGNTFDFVAVHGRAVADAGYGFISASAEAFANGAVSNAPAVVDLILGKQKEVQSGTGHYGTRYKTFPTALQDRLAAYTAAGGNVFVSGSFVATDLWDNPHSSKEVAEADQKFAQEVLGYHWRVGQACSVGEAYEVQSVFKPFSGGKFSFANDFNPTIYGVQSPDSFYAADKEHGATIMRYSENNLVAGIAYNPGSYRTVVIGFPFETITAEAQRNEMMCQVLTFLMNN